MFRQSFPRFRTVARRACPLVAAAVIGLPLGQAHAEPIEYSLDVLSGQEDALSPAQHGFTGILGNPDESVEINGVTFTLFGFPEGNHRDRGVSDDIDGHEHEDLLRDFAFNDGDIEAIGLRIEDLPAGTYDVRSWHYDSVVAGEMSGLVGEPDDEEFPGDPGGGGAVDIGIREQGQGVGDADVLVSDFNFQTDAAEYQFTADGQTTYEMIFRETGWKSRSRLNAITIVPTPATLPVLGAMVGLILARRPRRA